MSYREHNIPLYKQILIDLKKKLKNGVWNIGDLFPSEKELMENYNVSSITIRRVLLELVNDGWIERRHGIGTFVKKEYVEPLEKLVGFFEQIYAKGRTPRAKMLFNGVVSLQEELLNEVPELQELNSDRIYSIIKTHFIDDKPVEYVCSYWSEEIGKKLINYDLETKGVYEILKEDFGIDLYYAEQEIKAISADCDIAKQLMVEEGVPILKAERVVYDKDDKAIEVTITTYHPDNYKCKIVSKRDEDQVDNDIFFGPIN